jgi:hypothetical protein
VPADGWTLTDKGGYPVDPATIRPILSALVDLKTVEPKTERPKLYDRLDLGTPGDKGSEAKSVDLADGNGADIVKLIVGRRRYGLAGNDDGIYVRKPDEARTWLAAPAFDLPADAMSWIDRKLVDIDADRIKSVSLTPAVFRYLDLTDVKPAGAVTAAPVATAHVETFDGMALDVTLIDQDGATWVKFAAKGGDAATEIAKRTGDWAYKIPDARVKTLETKLADLQAPPPAKGS